MNKVRAPRNRTVTLTRAETDLYGKDLIHICEQTGVEVLCGKILNQDVFEIVSLLPKGFVDLLILDPPYNLNKTFTSAAFRKKSIAKYAEWFEGIVVSVLPTLKRTASVYVCAESHSSTAVHLVLDKFLKVRSRITWEREKGRGARKNWKNGSEDIWFATVSDQYIFNMEEVKLKRRVLAPDIDRAYCLLAAKRLRLAEFNGAIQGCEDGVFGERNANSGRKSRTRKRKSCFPAEAS